MNHDSWTTILDLVGIPHFVGAQGANRLTQRYQAWRGLWRGLRSQVKPGERFEEEKVTSVNLEMALKRIKDTSQAWRVV